MELLGLAGAHLPDGSDAMPELRRLATRQDQLGMWAAPSTAGKRSALTFCDARLRGSAASCLSTTCM